MYEQGRGRKAEAVGEGGGELLEGGWGLMVSALNGEGDKRVSRESESVRPEADWCRYIGVWALIGLPLDSNGDTCTSVFIDQQLCRVCACVCVCWANLAIVSGCVNWSFPVGQVCKCVGVAREKALRDLPSRLQNEAVLTPPLFLTWLPFFPLSFSMLYPFIHFCLSVFLQKVCSVHTCLC